MANGCALLQNTFAAGDRHVICPRPQRLFSTAPTGSVTGNLRPFRWTAAFPADPSDPKPTSEILDVLFSKTDSTPPFFCGSPPSRSVNPVVHDARFGEAVPTGPVQPGPVQLTPVGSESASSRVGCARIRYGLSPAAVRVEGFDCLDRESSRSRGITAYA